MLLYYDTRIADDAANRPLLVFVVLDQPHKCSRVAECTKYRLLARANGIHLLAEPKVDSNLMAPRVRRKRQRLPPNLLIENASDRDSPPRKSRPEAFPIKASGKSEFPGIPSELPVIRAESYEVTRPPSRGGVDKRPIVRCYR